MPLPPQLLPPRDYYPLYEVLCLRQSVDDEWVVEPRAWGFLPSSWKPTEKVRTAKSFQRGKINARSETADQTWPWRFSFSNQRCVILASSFFEPDVDGGDANYQLNEAPIFAIAGLWAHFEGDTGKGTNESIDSCVMLTTDANSLVASTRKGRMRQPVLLQSNDDISRYCSLEVSEHASLTDLFQPTSDRLMTCRRAAELQSSNS